MTNPAPIYPTFKYVSAPCGSGKTTQLCNIINESLTQSNTEKYIIVQNTQALAKQTAKNFDKCELIISDLNKQKKNVINTVLDFLKNPTKRVLIISDKTFFKVPVELLTGWQIWLDDVTNFHSFKNVNDDNEHVKNIIYHGLMMNHEIVDESTEKYLTAKKKAVKGDLLNKIAQELSVITENDIFIMNKDYFDDPEKVQLSILGWKDLSKYIGLPVTFMGANFENSLIYKAKPEFFEKIELADLRQRNISINQRLKVYYFSENTKLSKRWKSNNSEKLQRVYEYLDTELTGQKFYWTNNNKDSHKLQNGTKISPDARGLNEYQDLNTCVWLACMLPDDTEAKLCELLLGISGVDIHQAREYENLHQFVLRGVSRKFDSTETQIVYVFDKWQAESLSTNIEHIPGVLDSTTPGVPGRPKGAKNANKLPVLSEAKSKRFRRWLGTTEKVDIASFNEFLGSKSNQDLSPEDKAAMLSRYEKAVRDRDLPVQSTNIKKTKKVSKNNPL